MIMTRYLIVANQTLGGERLVARIAKLLDEGPATLRFAVPVTDAEGSHQWDYPPTDRYIPDAHQIATVLAEERLQRELARLRALGVDADGEVVAPNPVQRIRDLTEQEAFTEVIVSTLPQTVSRWLRLDLPHRLARVLSVPISQIEGEAGPPI
jgi:nucleotide-binding universal stress UspA family protein